MAKITAEEARKIAGLSVEEEVDIVFDLIREAATDKERSIKVMHNNLWATGGYAKSPHWVKACKILNEEGFKTDYYFSEDYSYVGFTIVSW
jgi:hypothetical protein